jgi:hypothetical protein
MTMYPSPMPAGQQRPQAFVATPGLYASPGPPARAAAAAVPASRPGPKMEPLARRQLGSAVADQLFQLHGAPPASYLDPGPGGGLWCDAPHHSISW